MMSNARILLLAVVLVIGAAVLVLWLTSDSSQSADEGRIAVKQPEDVDSPAWLAERRDRQLATVDQFDVFHDFRFTDQLEESGIQFSHKIVDDAGKSWKMVHYDHGNGVAVADVDSDGFYDIYFTNQVGSNELWRNLGNGTFEDITHQAGVGLADAISVAPSFADADNDGDQDLYVTTVRFGNHLFKNDGTGHFIDVSQASGLDYVGHSSGTVFFDYDRDGLLDLFLTNVGTYTTDELSPIRGLTRFDQQGSYEYYVGFEKDAFMGHLHADRAEANRLYRNLGDLRFEDVSEQTGMLDSSWSGDATVFDANEDGWPDLYILSMQGNDVFYENIEGRRFELKSPETFPQTPYGAMGLTSLDFNNDGRMDLYVTDMHSDMWETDEFFDEEKERLRPRPENVPTPEFLGTAEGSNVFGNALFRNDGGGRFTEVAEAMGAETYWPWGVSSGDLNADGYEDLFVVSSMNFPYRYTPNLMLLNNRGRTFLNSEFVLGVEPRGDGRTAKVWFEVDCAVESDPLCDQHGEDAKIDVWGSIGSRSAVLFDLENDGDLDIVTNDFNSEPMVLVSDLSERNPDLNYLKVKLRGTASNRDGLGAVVRVQTDSLMVTKVADGKSGYLSQSSYPLYFGLGSTDVVRSLEVTWPSGRTQQVEVPAGANQLIEVVEP